jgi:RiboL-PSP-HEPN
MSGRSEVASLKSRLDATFARVNRIDVDELELRSDFARYLCVLVCGYLERAIVELLLHHTSIHADTAVAGYVGWRLTAGFQNPSSDKIKRTLGAFEPRWRDDLETYIVDERAAAIGSVLWLRNRIAHGEWSDITYVRIKDYYAHIQDVVEHVADLVVPSGAVTH